jgi:Skp family chaperone for outer membrane proteins
MPVFLAKSALELKGGSRHHPGPLRKSREATDGLAVISDTDDRPPTSHWFLSSGELSVKRQLAIAALVAATFVSAAHAQAPGQPAIRPVAPAASSPIPTHVAVIDVGVIFKNHAGFKAAMDKMKDEVLAAENSLKAERDRINGLMEQIKSFNVGTPEYRKHEAEVAKAQGDFNVTAQLQKKDFMDREAQVYLQIYSQIEKAVAQFSRENGIAVVHRFDGDTSDNGDRNRILGNITKPIVFYDPQIDITPDILRMLNGATPVAGQPMQPRR